MRAETPDEVGEERAAVACGPQSASRCLVLSGVEAAVSPGRGCVPGSRTSQHHPAGQDRRSPPSRRRSRRAPGVPPVGRAAAPISLAPPSGTPRLLRPWGGGWSGPSCVAASFALPRPDDPRMACLLPPRRIPPFRRVPVALSESTTRATVPVHHVRPQLRPVQRRRRRRRAAAHRSPCAAGKSRTTRGRSRRAVAPTPLSAADLDDRMPSRMT